MMEKLCGPIPLEMARNAKNEAKECFDREGILDWPALSGGSLVCVCVCVRVCTYVGVCMRACACAGV